MSFVLSTDTSCDIYREDLKKRAIEYRPLVYTIDGVEHFDEFIHADITEDTASDKPYPVGVGPRGERIHFMHYPDFATAKAKWIERRQRIDTDNMAVMLTNLGVGTECIGGVNQLLFNDLTASHSKTSSYFQEKPSMPPT